ncbi:MAG TPA: hypothetical protein VGQ92_06175, partial [Actinoplanes sp.]|nr:hypothetical protein [Actinoplanes sp.]
TLREGKETPARQPMVTGSSFSLCAASGGRDNHRVTLHRRVGGFTVVAGLAAILTAGPAGPAVAHGGGPSIPDAAYYRTALSGDNMLPPGVTASVDPAGEWLEVGYTGPAEVIVLGYSGEPYLRITARSAEENTLSPTTYLNKAGFADLPAGSLAATVAPVWQPIAAVGRARWHDHRIHWMGQIKPPAVAADPTRAHVVSAWTVHAIDAGQPFDIRGTLNWAGKPSDHLSRFAWLILAVGNLPFVVAGVMLAVMQRRRRAGRGPGAPTAGSPAPMVTSG